MFREPRRLEELPPFDPRTIEVVRKSCAALPSDSVLLTQEFYKQLFDMAPQARPLFPEDMTGQNERLLKAILMAVNHLDRPEMVELQLRRWGAIHRHKYGITNDLYVYVAHSLVRALRALNGGYLETTVASCWMAVYEWMAAVMIDGADQAEKAERDAELDARRQAKVEQAPRSTGPVPVNRSAQPGVHAPQMYAAPPALYATGPQTVQQPEQQYPDEAYGAPQGQSGAQGYAPPPSSGPQFAERPQYAQQNQPAQQNQAQYDQQYAQEAEYSADPQYAPDQYPQEQQYEQQYSQGEQYSSGQYGQEYAEGYPEQYTGEQYTGEQPPIQYGSGGADNGQYSDQYFEQPRAGQQANYENPYATQPLGVPYGTRGPQYETHSQPGRPAESWQGSV